MGGKWDYYKVAKGTPLTRSRKSSGAYRGLVHGGKGVRKQAEFFKVERRGSILGTLGAFAGKALLAVLMIGTVIAIAAVLLAAVVNGVSAGLADVAAAVSSASEYLVIGAGVVAVVAIGSISLKVRQSVRRAQARAAERAEIAEARRMAAQEKRAAQAERLANAQIARAQQSMWVQQAEASRATTATPADWYPDPSNPAQFRYWDGAKWTERIAPRQTTPQTPAGWYPSHGDVSRLQYWDGRTWTAHFRPAPGHRDTRVPATNPPPHSRQSTDDKAGRTSMTSAEWQSHVRAWMTAGAIEQELWRRLSNAQISDADQNTLEAQRQMEELTAEQGAERMRLMLEANPGLRDELGITAFLNALLQGLAPIDRRSRVGIDPARDAELPR